MVGNGVNAIVSVGCRVAVTLFVGLGVKVGIGEGKDVDMPVGITTEGEEIGGRATLSC